MVARALERFVFSTLLRRRVLALLGFIGGLGGMLVALQIESPFASVMSIGLLAAAATGFYPTEFRPRSVAFPSVDVRAHLTFYILTAAVLALTYSGIRGRQPIVLILTGVLYTTTAAAALTSDRPQVALGMAVVTSLIHKGSIYWASSLFLGNDVFYHNRAALQIAELGTRDPLVGKYFFAPLYHLLVASGVLVPEVTVRVAAFFVITVPLAIVPCLLIYTILKPVMDAKFATLGGLLYSAMDGAIFFAVMPQATSLGLFFGLFILTLTYLSYIYGDTYRPYLASFLLICLFLTHQISSLIIATALSGLWIGKVLAERRALGNYHGMLGLPLLAWLGVGAILTFSPKRVGSELTVIQSLALQLSDRFGGYGTSTRTPAQFPADWSGVPMGTGALTVWHAVGSGILFALVSIAIVRYFPSKNHEPELITSLVPMTILLYAGGFVPSIVGFGFLIPMRWLPFVYFPAVCIGVYTIRQGMRLPAIGDRQAVVTALVLALLIVSLMGITYWGSPDAAPTPGRGSQEFATSPQSEAMYSFTDEHANSRAWGDFLAAVTLKRWYATPADPVQTDTDWRLIATQRGDLVVQRPYSSTNRANYFLAVGDRFARTAGPIDPDALACPSRPTIYDGGTEYGITVVQQASTSCRG